MSLKKRAKDLGLCEFGELDDDGLQDMIERIDKFSGFTIKKYEPFKKQKSKKIKRKSLAETASVKTISDVISPITKIDTKITKINNIYHIADLHVLPLKRHEEYQQVFDNIISFLDTDGDLSNSVMCIVGDIVHEKDKLKAETIMFIRSFLEELTKRLFVIITPGNHDFLEKQPYRMDNITPIVAGIDDNLIYIKNSGLFLIGNIIFAVSSLIDSKFIYHPNINFGDEILDGVDDIKTVSLFHGVVECPKLSDPRILHSAETRTREIDEFNGFDYVLLGDIHKKMYLKGHIAYPGSLIQQNFGEEIGEHGLIKWNLKKDKKQFVEIGSEYGFVTPKIINGIWTNPEIEFPLYAYIRYWIENSNREDICFVQAVINSKITPMESRIKNVLQQSTTKEIIDDKIEAESVDATLADYTSDLSKLTDFELIKLEYEEGKDQSDKKVEIADDIKRLVKIHKKITRDLDFSEAELGQKLILKKLTFRDMFGYHGSKNIIDFDINNGILNISGENYSGKTTLWYVILFTLFDNFPGKVALAGILNHSAKSYESCIDFRLGDHIYKLTKNGKLKGDKVTKSVNLQKLSNDKYVLVSTHQKHITENYIGNMNMFIATNVFANNIKWASILDLSGSERHDTMAELFGLDKYDVYRKRASEYLKTYKTKYSELCGQRDVLDVDLDIDETENALANLGKTIVERKALADDLRETLDILEKTFSKENDKMSDLVQNLVDIDSFGDFDEMSFAVDEIREEYPDIDTWDIDVIKWNNEKVHLELELDSFEITEDEITIALNSKSKKKNKKKLTGFLKLLSEFTKEYDTISEITDKWSLEYAKTEPYHKVTHEFAKAIDRLTNIKDRVKDKTRSLSKEIKNKSIADFGDNIITGFKEITGDTITKSPIYDILKKHMELFDGVSITESGDKIDGIEKVVSNFDVYQELVTEVVAKTRFLPKTPKKPDYDEDEKITYEEDMAMLDDEIKKLEKKTGRTKDLDLLIKTFSESKTISDELHGKIIKILKSIKSGKIFSNHETVNEKMIKKQKMEFEYQTKIVEMEKEYKKYLDIIEENKIITAEQQVKSYIIFLSMSAEIYIIQKQKDEMQIKREKINKMISLCGDIGECFKYYDILRRYSGYYTTYKLLQKHLSDEQKCAVYEQYQGLIDNLEMKDEYLSITAKNDMLQLDIDDIQDNMIEIKLDKEQKSKCLRLLVDDIADDRVEYGKLEEQIRVYNKNKKQLLEISVNINEIAKKKHIYEQYVKIMNKYGIPSRWIEHALHGIQKTMNAFLDGICEFNVAFNINITRTERKLIDIVVHKGEFTLGASIMSGYEKFVFNMGFKQALGQFSNCNKVQFICIDEGLDVIDEMNWDIRLPIILERLRKFYQNILIISHIDKIGLIANHQLKIKKTLHDSKIVIE
uniref:Calcineurin-like phosphoesterase domain-containing protein n=1 Tax=viral metagenome TaxID=1070528 RepID=A0A6C0IWB2_9ZZZZ